MKFIINLCIYKHYYEWIATVRISEAKNQLINNHALPIAEIAAYVGVDNRSNFDKLFKRMEGVSPATYRINYAKERLKPAPRG